MKKVDLYFRMTIPVDVDSPEEAMVEGAFEGQRIVNEINKLDCPEAILWEVKERKGNVYLNSVEEAREFMSNFVCHEDN